MNRLANTRAGQLLADFAMGAAVIVPGTGGAAVALADAQPAMADGNTPALFGGAVLPGAPEAGAAAVAATDPLQQECINAGLIMPQVKYAFMTKPGVRTGNHEQNVRLAAEYPAIPDQYTDQCRRIGEAWVQIKVNNKWRNMMTGWRSWVYNSNMKGPASVDVTPTGHEEDWYFWEPGEKVRGLLENIVKDPNTGKVEGQKQEVVPVQVRHHHAGHH